MENESHFTPLSELFKAVSDKNEISITVQQKIVASGLRYVTFLKSKQMEAAAEALHSIAPNLVYPEKAYIATKGRLSALFSFGNKAGDDIQTILREGITLADGYILKTAPAYRVNYSRLITATLRTLKQNGCKINLSKKSTPEVNSMSITILEGLLRNSPIKKTLMIPLDSSEIWLVNRGNTFYIIGINICDIDKIIATTNATLPKASIYKKNFINHTLLNINQQELLFEEWLKASATIKPENIKLDGCNFEFSPSAPDVIGYADTKFDEVKRMDVNVNTFKNTVFDFGTHIDKIIERTYDLYSEYHNGQKAFDAAVKEFMDSEL